MEQLRIGFEKSLKTKLSQKCTINSSEETVLFKGFKYFDTDNDGEVSLEEFMKAIEKIGVIVPSIENLKELYNYYDTNHDGTLDYKEFSEKLFRPQEEAPSEKEERGSKAEARSGPKGKEPEDEKILGLMERIREKLASRGARGIIGLGKSFRIMDDDNSFSLELHEFQKAMRDYRLGFTEDEIVTVFNAFDINRDGSISYDEFLRKIRGKLSDYRKSWIKRAFAKLDKDGNGVIELSDIKGVYNAQKHPDVLQGKRTEDDVLLEFLETFEVHHNILMGKEKDHVVTSEEFEEYYANVSSSIDNEEYFGLMMKNAWKLDEASKVYGKGWKAEEETKAPKGSPPKFSKASPQKKKVTNASSIDNTLNLGAQLQNKLKVDKKASPAKAGAGVDDAVLLFRKKLAGRGTRGILGIARQFRIMDDNNSKTLSYDEFEKAVTDYRVGVDVATIKVLFSAFDKDKSGTIDYDEFLRGVRGPMNEFRVKLVERAFNKLDADGSGVIESKDLKGVYNPKNHPDVKSGKKTEDEVLGEFLETFEMHLNLGGGTRDQKITKEEFLEYYNNVSASIDNDEYFELMMVNAWKLGGAEVKKPAWKGEYAAGKAGSPPPYGVSDTPVEYSKKPAGDKFNSSKEETKYGAAGISSRPKTSGAGASPEKSKSLIDTFRQTLLSRGARGIFGIQRVFKIVDDDNSRKLSMAEFKKVIKDYRIKMEEKDCETLFRHFDKDRSGEIDYDEFLRETIGEMNAFRKGIVKKVFKKLDKDGSGVITAEDLKGVYNAAKHPDVLSKKKTEEEVLTDFLDTFEQHYSFVKEGERDGKVTEEEFEEYYNNVSASIDNDQYFELMMTNAWNLGGKSYGKGWAGQY